jgi:hypothetical protein
MTFGPKGRGPRARNACTFGSLLLNSCVGVAGIFQKFAAGAAWVDLSGSSAQSGIFKVWPVSR